MNDIKKLYTIEDIAVMMSFTSRTIRNYLKDGSLQGNKVGGQWRFTMEDIKRLLNNGKFQKEMKNKNRQQTMDFIDGADTDSGQKVRVFTVIDYYCDNAKDGYRTYEKLVTMINNKKDDPMSAKFNYEFIEDDKKARFTLSGSPDYIIKTLQMV